MKIVLAADHGGFELKEKIKDWLIGEGVNDVVDVGANVFNAEDDFPPIANRGVKMVLGGRAVGIFVCGSGTGVCMAANRHKGVRAALCHSVEYAKLARSHNDANVLCLGGRFVDFETAQDIIEAFLYTEFLGGKYQKRMKEIDSK